MTKEQAVQTAGERLEAIERWTRFTCHAMMVCAIMLTVLACIAVYGVSDYVRFKSAVVEVVHEMASGKLSGAPRAASR